MAWFRNLSVRGKLFVALGPLALATGLVQLGGLWAVRRSSQVFTFATERRLPALEALLQADRDMQQALVAERSLLAVRPSSPLAEAQREAHKENLGQIATRWAKYKSLAPGEGEEEQRATFDAAFDAWKKSSADVLELAAVEGDGARQQAADLSFGETAPLFDAARDVLDKLEDRQVAVMEAEAATEADRETLANRALFAAMVLVFAVVVIVAVLLARAIALPLRAAAQALAAVATGDLRVALDVRGRDEVGRMSASLNEAMAAIRTLVATARVTAAEVVAASRQLAGATREISSGAQAQASSLEESAASLEEMTATVKQNAENAAQADQLAMRARDVAGTGGRVIGQTIDAMREIEASSKQIGEIIATIDEIAFQTNLLALNAAVEAARAGEQGRGFAVVAAEVRSLAQRSASAAREIKSLIQASLGKVEAGAGLVQQSGATLDEIVASVRRVTDVVSEIAAASGEQAAGIDQVNRAVSQMDEVTQANAAQTEELTGTSAAMAQRAEELLAAMARFTTDGVQDAPADEAAEPPAA